MNFLRSWPFLSASFVQSALALAVTLGWHLDARQTGSIQAAAAAVLAVLVAPHVKETAIPLFLGALTAIGAVLVAFKVPHVTPAEVSAIVAALSALLGTQGHQMVTNTFLAAKPAGHHPEHAETA